ncbi:hypothetical protein [Anaeropeptidivorans aminofermentans]|nr:hypothetical protein [Anaeropeptidivorans aminofermentans]
MDFDFQIMVPAAICFSKDAENYTYEIYSNDFPLWNYLCNQIG